MCDVPWSLPKGLHLISLMPSISAQARIDALHHGRGMMTHAVRVGLYMLHVKVNGINSSAREVSRGID